MRVRTIALTCGRMLRREICREGMGKEEEEEEEEEVLEIEIVGRELLLLFPPVVDPAVVVVGSNWGVPDREAWIVLLRGST